MAKKTGGALSEAAAALGRKGGPLGGKARAKVLSKGEMKAIAKLGGDAKARKHGKKKQ